MNKKNVIGVCPICERDLIENTFIDEHHLVPKSEGGKYSEKVLIHRVCHDKIHSTWTDSELAGEYHTIDRIKSHPEIEKFVKWISKKPPEFYIKTKSSNEKKKKVKRR